MRNDKYQYKDYVEVFLTIQIKIQEQTDIADRREHREDGDQALRRTDRRVINYANGRTDWQIDT